MSSSSYLEGLNPAQIKAVLYEPKSSLQILAGPGSGKTRVLTTRIAHMVLNHNVKPPNIVAVTFTNKAAKEMKDRLSTLIEPKKVESLIMGTFHSVCVRYLRNYGKHMNPPLAKGWTIADQDDTKEIVKDICKELKDIPPGMPDYIRNQISWHKAKCISYDELRDIANSTNDASAAQTKREVARIFELYQKKLKNLNALDFDDLLVEGIRLFSQVPVASKNIEIMLVDEFQDTNSSQFELMKLMAHTGFVSVVGDPDQSIYGWRAAEINNLKHMKKHFKDTEEIYLEQNYRSSGSIVKAALAVVSQDTSRPPKSLTTDHPNGTPVVMKSFVDGEEEAFWIAKEIRRLIAYSGKKLNYEDFVILLRFNALSRVIETALNKNRIPVRVLAGVKFFDRAEVKDILSYLTIIMNPDYIPSLRRSINTPKRGIGPKSIEEIENVAQKAGLAPFTMLEEGLINNNQVKGFKQSWKKLYGYVKAISDLKQSLYRGEPMADGIGKLITDIKFEEHLRASNVNDIEVTSRIENLKELISFAASVDRDNHEGTLFREDEEFDSIPDENFARLNKFLEISSLDVSLINEQETIEEMGKVTIATIHSAKGLEWPIVFLPATEEGVLPFYKCISDKEVKEERRLLYVGMTRAKAMLNISYAAHRFVAGSMKGRDLSTFLNRLQNDDAFQNDIPLIDRNVLENLTQILRIECPSQEDVDKHVQEYNKLFAESFKPSKTSQRYSRTSLHYDFDEINETHLKPAKRSSFNMFTTASNFSINDFNDTKSSITSASSTFGIMNRKPTSSFKPPRPAVTNSNNRPLNHSLQSFQQSNQNWKNDLLNNVPEDKSRTDDNKDDIKEDVKPKKRLGMKANIVYPSKKQK